MLVGLCGVCVGVYAGLDHTAPRLLATPMLLLGVAAAVAGLVLAGRRVGRTRYRPDPWRWPEFVVMLSGIASAGGRVVGGRPPARGRLPRPRDRSRRSRRSRWSASCSGLLAAVAAPEPRMVAA